jgi:N6-adenosine-specific RNA methylase IME4
MNTVEKAIDRAELLAEGPYAELLAEGPYAELFARRRRRGWRCYGNDLGKSQ